MPTQPRISQVPVYAIGAPPGPRAACAPRGSAGTGWDEVSPGRRWQCCRLSADVAGALGIALERVPEGAIQQVRICVTDADVHVLYNPGYVEYLGKSDSFVVEGAASGSHRVEIYANSGPGARDGGVFKLFGGGNPFAGASIPTNARVTLCREELVQAAAV